MENTNFQNSKFQQFQGPWRWYCSGIEWFSSWIRHWCGWGRRRQRNSSTASVVRRNDFDSDFRRSLGTIRLDRRSYHVYIVNLTQSLVSLYMMANRIRDAKVDIF